MVKIDKRELRRNKFQTPKQYFDTETSLLLFNIFPMISNIFVLLLRALFHFSMADVK